jgi:hypothetical protein
MSAQYLYGVIPTFVSPGAKSIQVHTANVHSWSAYPSTLTVTRDAPLLLLCARGRNRYRDNPLRGSLIDSVANAESIDSGEGRVHPLTWQ